MNMSQREKLLAIGVGLVVVVIVGNYLLGSVRKGFETKQDLIATLQKEKDDKALQVVAGNLSKAKLNRVLPQSLPSNEEKARATYMEWLIDVAEEAGLSDPQPRTLGETKEGDLYQSFKFQLTGTGTIENATKLLYAFQAKDYLHRVLRFDLRPLTNSNPPYRMTIMLDCEAIALRTAKPNQDPPTTLSTRVHKPLDEYLAAITERNIFAPSNVAPQLAKSRNVDATLGNPIDVTIDAKESDPGQFVSFEFDGDTPKGMKIDPKTGKLSWIPSELGSVAVSVRATDSGIPARSTVQLVNIKVSDPPPPRKEPPKFDVASQAYITALIADEKGPAAWVRSKTEGKTVYLRKGDELKLGDVTGKVIDVRPDFLELESDGKRWTVGLDESIADAYKKAMDD